MHFHGRAPRCRAANYPIAAPHDYPNRHSVSVWFWQPNGIS
jgi:hypothetical protein